MERETARRIEKVWQQHYLSPEQLNNFYRLLSSWREQVRADYQMLRERIRHREENGGDIIDQSTTNNTKTMEMLQRDRKHLLLQQIDAAIRRIEDGSYGYCQATEEEIGFDRLHAYPIATLSVTAQESRERRVSWKMSS